MCVSVERFFFFSLLMAEKANTVLYLAEQTEPGRPLARVTVLQSCRGIARTLKYMDSSRRGDPASGRGLLCGFDGVHGEPFVPARVSVTGVMSWGVTPM